MTKYLDEYQPNTRIISKQVQSDAHKLKFNNIQSCVAIVLLPASRRTLVGVHLTTWTTNKPNELAGVMQELAAAVGGEACDAYLVTTYGHHSQTQLRAQLKGIARSIYLCDVPPTSSKAADVDVKVELNGGRLTAYVRNHAVFQKDTAGAAIPNPHYDRATALPGKPAYLTDRDDKPWMAVAFRPLL